MDVAFVLQAVVVLGAIVMGTRASGIAVGLWGGLGVAVLVFVFGVAPGEPPIAAVEIILAVVTAASTMQACGGIDWMVKVAARIIERRPQQITLIAPLTAFTFSVGAGTSNILYPLMPVIFDVAYRNGIRPERPMSVAITQSGIALSASPVSAAMAAMLTLTDAEPYSFGLAQILAVTIPSCLAAIVVTALVVSHRGKELADDPVVQERIRAGLVPPPTRALGDGDAPASAALTSTREGRNAAVIFLVGVVAIVLLGLFPHLRPTFTVDGETVRLGMTTAIVLVMFVAAVVMLLVCRPPVRQIPEMPVFRAGMVSAIALFGVAWLTSTFIEAHEEYIVDALGAWVDDFPWVFAVALFVVAALTSSQSTATRAIVPIGLAAGISPALVTGMWAGALGGVFALPTGGPQIAAANFDQSGTTRLGTKLVDHSFFVPMLIMSGVAVVVGSAIALVVF